jgi:hypothetical protein
MSCHSHSLVQLRTVTCCDLSTFWVIHVFSQYGWKQNDSRLAFESLSNWSVFHSLFLRATKQGLAADSCQAIEVSLLPQSKMSAIRATCWPFSWSSF